MRQLPPSQLKACFGQLSALVFEILASYQLMVDFHEANQSAGGGRVSKGSGGGGGAGGGSDQQDRIAGGGDEHMALVRIPHGARV